MIITLNYYLYILPGMLQRNNLVIVLITNMSAVF